MGGRCRLACAPGARYPENPAARNPQRSKLVEVRNAAAAVIGAGDYIGAAIARKFALEGFSVFAGRRQGDKLAPLVSELEASGSKIFARALDARKEDDLTAFLQEADKQAPLEV